MQPELRVPLVTTRLDQALREVRRYNRAHPDAPLGVKLRIYSGNQAPLWAKKLDGGPIRIKRNKQGCRVKPCKIKIGKVWDPVYIAAWRDFQAQLAKRYDWDPLIRSVAITSCAMETDEPFVMPLHQKIPEGYTDKAGKACLRGAVDDYAGWKRTAIDYTVNPFFELQTQVDNVRFSIDIMNRCRTALGNRCELGNHSISNDLMPNDEEVVQAISDRRGPIHYQTEGPTQEGLRMAGGHSCRATLSRHGGGVVAGGGPRRLYFIEPGENASAAGLLRTRPDVRNKSVPVGCSNHLHATPIADIDRAWDLQMPA